jgi:acyl-CoA synthetase (AMP-forming)/AMP-acid ligase II/thioesterase domain-containing protein
MFFDFSRFGSIRDIGLGLHWDQETFTREVEHRVIALSQLRLGRGSIIAVAHTGTACFFADLFSIWRVGATAACLDPSLTDAELRTVLDFAKPAALLVDRAVPSGALPVLVLQLATLRPTRATVPMVDVGSEDDALVLFTSGTTGTPKGVVLTFGALKTRLQLNAAAIGAANLRRALVTLPTHFGHGLIGNALTPLTSGGDIVLCPRGTSLGDGLGKIIDEHKISFLSSVPTLWRIALGSNKAPKGNSLRRVHVGSAPLAPALWSEIAAWSRADVVNCYGMTETANWIAGASSREDAVADGLVGRPWGGIAAVMDDRGTVEAIGEGEIVIQSPCLMRGYLRRPDLTAAAISNGWFRTGDRGTVDESGRIWITGRIKDEIIRAGFKIQPAELDSLIEQHPVVAEACVFAIPDRITGDAIGVAVRPTTAATTDLSSVRSWCQERLRRDAVPEHWFVVQEIPRNARGKVNRAALRQSLLETADALPQPVEVVSNDRSRAAGGVEISAALGKPDDVVIRRAVERAWTSVIDRASFKADRPWCDAGGDSIGALSLLHDLERYLGRSIPLDVLRIGMTPSDLVHNVAAICDPGGERSGCAQQDPRLPLVFLIPPAYGDLPALAEFRAALSLRVRFDVIQYPSLGEMLDCGAGFELLVEAAVSRINAVCGDQRCLLAGYSFGGFVAFEAARRLIDSGRRVDLLALIDTRLERPPEETTSFLGKTVAYVRRNWSRPGKLYQDSVWVILSILVRHSPLGLLRRIDDFATKMRGSTAVAMRIEIFTLLRAHAIRGWIFKPLAVPMTLFRSDDAPSNQPDLGWGALCSQLTVQPINGGHRSLFEPQYRDALCAQFVRTVEDAASKRCTSGAAPSAI